MCSSDLGSGRGSIGGDTSVKYSERDLGTEAVIGVIETNGAQHCLRLWAVVFNGNKAFPEDEIEQRRIRNLDQVL